MVERNPAGTPKNSVGQQILEALQSDKGGDKIQYMKVAVPIKNDDPLKNFSIGIFDIAKNDSAASK